MLFEIFFYVLRNVYLIFYVYNIQFFWIVWRLYHKIKYSIWLQPFWKNDQHKFQLLRSLTIFCSIIKTNSVANSSFQLFQALRVRILGEVTPSMNRFFRTDWFRFRPKASDIAKQWRTLVRCQLQRFQSKA